MNNFLHEMRIAIHLLIQSKIGNFATSRNQGLVHNVNNSEDKIKPPYRAFLFSEHFFNPQDLHIDMIFFFGIAKKFCGLNVSAILRFYFILPNISTDLFVLSNVIMSREMVEYSIIKSVIPYTGAFWITKHPAQPCLDANGDPFQHFS